VLADRLEVAAQTAVKIMRTSCGQMALSLTSKKIISGKSWSERWS